MDHHLCVLLYSKYSPLSNQLMQGINTAPVNLNSVVGLNPICIDHEEVRARILKANQIEVSHVPCILLVYPNGGVEKYEGTNAFKWVSETVRKHIPPPPPQPPPQPRPPPKPKNPPPPEEDDYEEEEEPPPRRPARKQPSKQQTPRKQPPRMPPATAIEDLDDEEEEEEMDMPQRPPVAVRSGPGGYDMTSEFGEPNEPNRDMSNRIRPNTQPTSGSNNDLMSTAMAMQKERENVDTNGPKPIGAPPNQRPV